MSTQAHSLESRLVRLGMGMHAGLCEPCPSAACAVCMGSCRSQFNPIWDFQYPLNGQGNCEMVFSSVTGHLMQMDFGLQHKKWYSCSPLELYSAPVLKFVPEVRATQGELVALLGALQAELGEARPSFPPPTSYSSGQDQFEAAAGAAGPINPVARALAGLRQGGGEHQLRGKD